MAKNGLQFKYDDLEKAKAKAKEIVASGCPLEYDSLQIIHDIRTNEFYVEDGAPMIRNFEKVLWSL